MKVESVESRVYRVPTERPEEDGTLQWDATVAVVVLVRAGDVEGLGWTYSTPAAAELIDSVLADVVVGRESSDLTGTFEAMRRTCRNFGLKGLVMQAISGVDVALWDLNGRAAQRPVCELLGARRRPVLLYGSGGFTNQTDEQLRAQAESWLADGCRMLKIKIGRDRTRDRQRLELLRALAPDAELMVDANGAYTRGEAHRVGHELDEFGVTWFEEPVTSDDVEGLGLLRAALRLDVTAGEYASDAYEAAGLCGALDCLQLDLTRCGGYTGFRSCAAVAAARGLDVSGHCAPTLHASLSGVANMRHIEYFVDHARLEPMLFDGIPAARDGQLTPNDTPGLGVTLRADAEQYRTS